MQQQTQIDQNQDQRVNRLKLSLLIIIPFTIMATAWTMFYTGIGIPSGTRNDGDLINPPLQINELSGAEAIVPGDDNVWRFLLPGLTNCNEVCVQRLYLTRQIHTALGRHAGKIERVYLKEAGQPLTAEFVALLAKEHPKLRVVDISHEQLTALLATNKVAAATDALNDFYIADPAGFVMLAYTNKHTYKDTMHDMKFLLKNAP